jgi:hypothetical protein
VDDSITQIVPFAAQHVGEVNNQDAIRDHHSLEHNNTHERLNIQRGSRER